MPLRFADPAPEAYHQPLTIRHLLDCGEASDSEQEIVYRDQVRLSYRDLRSRIARLADMLTQIGVDQGTTVAVFDWDSHRYLECFFAIPMIGAVLQTVNVRLSPAQIEHCLRHAGAEYLLVHRDFLPLLDQIRARLPKVRGLVVMSDDQHYSAPGDALGEYEALLAAANGEFPFADFDENALATTFYTSGTTGLPKSVCFSHRQLVLHTLALAAALGTAVGQGLHRSDVYMPLTPMFHVHAWGMPYAATMLGLKQVYPGRYEPALIARLRKDEGVTFSHCVPTVLQMVLDAAARTEVRLDGWHMVIGGSALTGELHAAALAAGVTLTSGYGMSETGPLIALGEAGPPHRATRTGRTVPLVTARIVDEAMVSLPPDDASLGELVLRAPWLTPCYPGDTEASRSLWRGGWLHTQDIATIDAGGSIQIRDRLKDVIKTGGEWICSLTLEELICAHPDVVEVAVVGVPDPKWQERPVAIIVQRGDVQLGRDAINDMLHQEIGKGTISRYALIDQVIVVDGLPRTSVGKVDKKQLRLVAVSYQGT